MLKYSVSGIRGIVGESMTPEVALRFSAAFGNILGGGRVVVGRDTRPSGEGLSAAVVSGLLGTGCDVIDVAHQYNLTKVRRSVRAGADVIVFGDDYSDKNAPLMGPKFFEEFVLPCLHGVVQAAKEEGAYVVKHTDGNIWSIMDMIVGLFG